MTVQHRPYLAVALALVGFLAFSVSDSLTRVMMGRGHDVFFVAGVFQFVALIGLFLSNKPLGGYKSAFLSRQKRLHLLRGVLVALIVPMNVFAFSKLPFALTYTLLFTGAFWAILLARPVTGERIPPVKALAVLGGFTGALIVLRPWGAFDWLMLIPLISSMFFALESLIARRFNKDETPFSLAFYPCVVCVLLMSVLTFLHAGFAAPAAADVGFIALGGAMMGTGFLCVPLAFRYGSAAVVGPFHYTQLIWAALLGALMFNETPDGWTILGGLVIAVSGLSALFLNRRAAAS